LNARQARGARAGGRRLFRRNARRFPMRVIFIEKLRLAGRIPASFHIANMFT